jgi:hypothetical protein
MRNRIVVDIRPQPSEPGAVSAECRSWHRRLASSPEYRPLWAVIMAGDALCLLVPDEHEQALDAP